MPFTILTQGTFTQPSTAVNMNINLPSSADYFKTVNYTQMGLTGTVCVAGEWFKGITAINDGLRWRKAGSSAILIDKFSTATASNGFTYVSTPPQPEAAVTGTTITQATAAVATQTNTYSEGDYIAFYNTVGMQQISGITFQISTVTGSGYVLLGLDSSGFAAAATAFTTRRVAKTMPVEPRTMFITAISKATNAEITFSEAHSYVVGQLVHFSVPAVFGMSQMNQLTGRVITATGTDTPTGSGVYKLTVNIDTSSFTTFAFPASASAITSQLFATMAPAGQQVIRNSSTLAQVGYNTSYAPFHSGQFVPYMYIPSGAASPGGAAGDVIIWTAYKMEDT